MKTALVAFLVTVLNRIMMPKYINENEDGRVTADYYRQELTPDIIFVGSSTVFSAVSPPILWEEKGYASYDRGNASQTIWISYYMIEDALKDLQRPGFVVLDVGFIKYDDNFVEEPSNRKSLDGMRLSPTKYRAVEAARGEDERFIEYLFPVLRFHTRWKELTLDDFKYAFVSPMVDHAGYLIDYEVTETVPDRRPGEYDKKTWEETRISPKNREYLIKIMELCRDKGVGLMLMKLPSLSDNWSLYYDEQVEEMAKPYGVSYINFDTYSDEMGIDYALDSPDEGSHLNTTGAEKFSRYLAEYLSENYDIKTRENDEAYTKVWGRIVGKYEADKKLKMDLINQETQ